MTKADGTDRMISGWRGGEDDHEGEVLEKYQEVDGPSETINLAEGQKK